MLIWLDEEIDIKLANMVEPKCVERIEGDALQEMHKKVLDGADVEELSSASVDELDNESIKEAVDKSELFESKPKVSEKEGEAEIKTETVEEKGNPLIDSIEALLEARTDLMLSQIKLDNASLNYEVKSNNETLKK